MVSSMNSTRLSTTKHTCFNCKEEFYVYVDNYIYVAKCKTGKYKKTQEFCSYNCRAKYLKEHPEAKICITTHHKK